MNETQRLRSLYARFEANFVRGNIDECWLWTGSINHGYGRIVIRIGHHQIIIGAHVLAWEIEHNNGVPENLEICHSCDNTICVNPNHLFLGTHQDNMRDCANKGRLHQQKQTHCVNGHEFNDVNMRISSSFVTHPNGQRICLACKRENSRRSRGGLIRHE